jgi:endo-alpha-1,4-polygalactosaminidase (GH114 family)
LKTILDQRIERQSEIKVMLDDAKENWNLEETLKQVKTMRNSCSSRIIPYIKNTETENFKKYCTQLWDNLTKKYTEK